MGEGAASRHGEKAMKAPGDANVEERGAVQGGGVGPWTEGRERERGLMAGNKKGEGE